MKVLFPISFNFQVRYLLRTGLLEKCSKFCEPIVLLFWEQSDLERELEAIGYKVYKMSYTKETSLLTQIRNRIDSYYFKAFVKSPTSALRSKHRYALMPFKKKVKHIISRIKHSTYSKSDFQKDKELLSNLIQRTPAWQEINEILTTEEIDCVFTTAPFLVSEDLVCRASHQRNIPIYYSVLSFDNPTTRGYLPFIPDRIGVWNKFNKEQLIRIWGEKVTNKIDVTGPPQFDFYFDEEWLIPEGVWRSSKGIPSDRPIIMYGANAKFWVPDEHKIVELIDSAIENGSIVGNPIVLLRPHPTDSYVDWEQFVKTLKHTYIEKSIRQNESDLVANNKFSNFTIDDIKALCSTLYYSSIHISYVSTLALDGICYNKPQVCPFFSPAPNKLSNRIIKKNYFAEHYLPITESGAVMFPQSEVELIEAINQSILEPNKLQEKRDTLKRTYLNNTNGMSVELLKQSFLQFLYSTR